MHITGWKIWYSDSTFSSSEGKWTDAPDNDVQAIVAYYDQQDEATGLPLRDIYHGHDHYAFDGKRFSFSDDDQGAGFYKAKTNGHTKHGAWMEDAGIERIIKQVNNDTGEGWLVPKRKTAKKPDTGLKAA